MMSITTKKHLLTSCMLVSFALSAGTVRAEDACFLVGVHQATEAKPQPTPAQTVVTVDIHSGDRLLTSRRITLRNATIRKHLYDDPMVLPGHADTAYLVTRSAKHGMHFVQLSWARGEDTGTARHVRQAFTSRPRELVPGKVGFFCDLSLHTLDFSLGRLTETRFGNRPLDLDSSRNRVYVLDRGLSYHPLLVGQPPTGVRLPANRSFELPDKFKAAKGAVRPDGLALSYVTVRPSLRPGAERFVWSVADHRGRLLVRRGLRGRPHDLRWLDSDRVLLTATSRERTFVHVLSVKHQHLKSRALSPHYLAVPEIVPARWLRAISKKH